MQAPGRLGTRRRQAENGATTPARQAGSFLLGAAASALLVATACQAGAAPTGGATPAEPARPAATSAAGAPTPVAMRLSYPSTGASSSVIWAAADAGFFERNGLAADVSYVESAATTLQALVSGGLDVAQAGASAPVNGAVQGADLVIFAGLINVLPYALMVTPEVQEGADLRGRRIGISRYGSSSDFAARYLLKHFGLRPEEDAAIVQVGNQGARLAALKQGGVDGGLFDEPFNVLIAREGFRELIKTAGMLPYLHSALFTSRLYMEAHAPAMRQFTRALVETIAYMKQNREPTKQIIAKYTKEDDPASLEAAYDSFVSQQLERVPAVSLDGVRTIIEEVALTAPEAAGQDPARFVDDRLVRELDTSGFIRGLYATDAR